MKHDAEARRYLLSEVVAFGVATLFCLISCRNLLVEWSFLDLVVFGATAFFCWLRFPVLVRMWRSVM